MRPRRGQKTADPNAKPFFGVVHRLAWPLSAGWAQHCHLEGPISDNTCALPATSEATSESLRRACVSQGTLTQQPCTFPGTGPSTGDLAGPEQEAPGD